MKVAAPVEAVDAGHCVHYIGSSFCVNAGTIRTIRNGEGTGWFTPFHVAYLFKREVDSPPKKPAQHGFCANWSRTSDWEPAGSNRYSRLSVPSHVASLHGPFLTHPVPECPLSCDLPGRCASGDREIGRELHRLPATSGMRWSPLRSSIARELH